MTRSSGTATVDIIAGARPNFMKIAPIIKAIQTRQAEGGGFGFRLVHTGQHYDPRMSGEFFSQLEIPAPDVNLEVGSGSQAQQTAAIMVRYEKLLLEHRSDLCLVVGDVNSTMACAIAARKLGIPVAHVEGGHSVGRLEHAGGNQSRRDRCDRELLLHDERVRQREPAPRRRHGDDQIFFVGNTMIDTLLANMARLRAPAFWADFALAPQEYFVVTLHRPANVDDSDRVRAGALRDRPRLPATARCLSGASAHREDTL